MDNCGEDVLDALLVREIRPGPEGGGVVKGRPVLTDVTMEDAKRSRTIDEFDEVITTGMFAVGIVCIAWGTGYAVRWKAPT